MSCDSREVIRCPHCNLNQFMTASGLCRKSDCVKPLKPNLETAVTVGSGYLAPIYKHQSYGAYTEDGHVKIGKIPDGHDGIDFTEMFLPTKSVIADIVSNVRRRGDPLTKINKQPRYNHEGLSIRKFPNELRLRCLEYAKDHKMSLRELVIKSLENVVDGK